MSIVTNPSRTIPTPERRRAVAAVGRACALARAVRRRWIDAPEVPDKASRRALTKDDRSPVTVADLGIQALLSLELGTSATWGEVPILGEESSALLRRPDADAERGAVLEVLRRWVPDLEESRALAAIDRCDAGGREERFWALDPIDGTKGFLRGGQYAVALALIEHGEVSFAVLGCPELPTHPGDTGPEAPRGCLLVAARGEGCEQVDLGGLPSPTEAAEELTDAFPAGQPVRVSAVTESARARLLESVEPAHSDHETHAAILAHLGSDRSSVRLDSQAKYAALARGEADVYLRLPRDESYQEKIWDHAAGFLVVTEAGGRVSDARGRPLDFTQGPTLAANRGIVASNGPYHAQVLDAVARATRREPREA